MSVWVRSHDECLTGFKSLEEALEAARKIGLKMGEFEDVKTRILYDSRNNCYDVLTRRKQP